MELKNRKRTQRVTASTEVDGYKYDIDASVSTDGIIDRLLISIYSDEDMFIGTIDQNIGGGLFISLNDVEDTMNHIQVYVDIREAVINSVE